MNKRNKLHNIEKNTDQKKYHYKILDNFKKELIKQLYQDLFKLNKDLFTSEKITYEYFLYEYYTVIDENINFDNPDYPGLVYKMNDIVKKRVLANKQNRELNEEIDDLYQNAEWELINKYKSSLEMEKKLQERKAKVEKMQKYNEELTKQIELNKILKKQNDIENEQKIEKQDKYLLDEKVAKKELQEMKIKECQEKNKSDEKNEEIDYNTIKKMNKDDMITMMVNKIMKEKRAEKIDSILNGIKSKYHKEEKEYVMPDIKYDQRKIDEILYKEMQKYQDI